MLSGEDSKGAQKRKQMHDTFGSPDCIYFHAKIISNSTHLNLKLYAQYHHKTDIELKDTPSINDNGFEDYENNFESSLEDEKIVKKQRKMTKRKSPKKKHSCSKDHPKIFFGSLDDYNDHFRSVHVYTKPSSKSALFMLKYFADLIYQYFSWLKFFPVLFLQYIFL